MSEDVKKWFADFQESMGKTAKLAHRTFHAQQEKYAVQGCALTQPVQALQAAQQDLFAAIPEHAMRLA